jgi:hypothetical protein
VYELKKGKIRRQFFLRNASVRSKPRTEQRPKTLHSVDVYFAKTIAVFISGKLAFTMVYSFMTIAPNSQFTIYIILVSVNESAGFDVLIYYPADKVIRYFKNK